MSADFRRAFAHVLPHWRRLAVVGALSLAGTGLALALPYLSRALVDEALLRRDVAALYRTVALLAIVSIAGFVVSAAAGLSYTRVSADILFDMRLAVYRHLQRLSPRFYARTPLGDILARVNNDISEIQRVAAESLLACVGNVLFLTGSVAAMFWLDARLAAVGVALVPLSVWTLARIRGELARRVARVRQAGADVGSFLIETLQAIRLMVTSNAEAREVDRFRRRNAAFIEALMSMQWWSYLAGTAPGLILSLGYAAVFVYGGRRVVAGTLTLGTFVAFMAYQMRLLQPVQALMGLYTALATVRVSLARVHALLDTAPEVVEPDMPAPLDMPGDSGTPASAIEFDDVSLDLGRGEILNHLSFAAAQGETLAIVGQSGTGKSTIADLLVRLLDPDRGTVRVNGRDVRTVALADLRRHVVLVDQEPCLLHATIADNIRYARPEASDADVREAARAADLEQLIDAQPHRFETIVGERGAQLSAGERQRIAIARALLVNAQVLVLDEPSASLDPIAERRVRESYERIMRGRTTILITHRLALASAADRVLVLAGTSIVEAGRPAELLEREGAFAALFG